VVDRTDSTAQAQGQQRAQEDNENIMRELCDKLERDRRQALREAQERAKIEDDAQRRQLARQRCEREEKEGKQKEEERFRKLKNELINYDFQTSPRIKKESFRDLVVDDISVLRIALIGRPGSGKTSLVGKNRFKLNCMLRESSFLVLSSIRTLITILKRFLFLTDFTRHVATSHWRASGRVWLRRR